MQFERTYGVEIECIAPIYMTATQLSQALNQAGIAAFVGGRFDSTNGRWKITHDGSIHTDHRGGHGLELVSPALSGEAGFAQIAQICGVINRHGFIINKSCGLHVHIDVRRPTALDIEAMKRLALLYVEHESLIDLVLPASRRGSANIYCRSIANVNTAELMRCEDTTQIARVLYGNPRLQHSATGRGRRRRYYWGNNESHLRYVKLNFMSLSKHGTVEFRHHSGTIDADKIRNWVVACLRMVDTAQKENSPEAAQEIRRAIATVRAGTKRAIVHSMLLRPEGCTTAEVLAATGWRQVSVAGIAHQYGMEVRQERRSGVTRYWGSNPGSVAPVARTTATVATNRPEKATTVAGLADRLGMSEEEKMFWLKRAEECARSTAEIVNN